MAIKAVNPTTGETIKEYKEMTPAEVTSVIEKTHQAFLGWRTTGFAERAELMKRAAQVLRNNSDGYAKLMAQEMGKPISGGRAEAEKCAWVCDYYAENAERFLQREMVETEATKSFVTFQPLGVVLAVMPYSNGTARARGGHRGMNEIRSFTRKYPTENYFQAESTHPRVESTAVRVGFRADGAATPIWLGRSSHQIPSRTDSRLLNISDGDC